MNQIMTGIIFVVLIVFSIFTIKNYVSKLGKGGCCGTNATSYKVKDKNIKNYPFHVTCQVEGMHCANCAKRIEDAFNSRGGILTKANHTTGVVEIYLKEEMTDEKIEKVITNQGYELISIQH